jgi:hypothetical protein
MAHVSSMNTKRLGLSCLWSSCQRIRSAAMSGRSCAAARTIFFKRDLLLSEEAPNRAIADTDIARDKLAPARSAGTAALTAQHFSRRSRTAVPHPGSLRPPQQPPPRASEIFRIGHRHSSWPPPSPPLGIPSDSVTVDNGLECEIAATTRNPIVRRIIAHIIQRIIQRIRQADRRLARAP